MMYYSNDPYIVWFIVRFTRPTSGLRWSIVLLVSELRFPVIHQLHIKQSRCCTYQRNYSSINHTRRLSHCWKVEKNFGEDVCFLNEESGAHSFLFWTRWVSLPKLWKRADFFECDFSAYHITLGMPGRECVLKLVPGILRCRGSRPVRTTFTQRSNSPLPWTYKSCKYNYMQSVFATDNFLTGPVEEYCWVSNLRAQELENIWCVRIEHRSWWHSTTSRTSPNLTRAKTNSFDKWVPNKNTWLALSFPESSFLKRLLESL